MGDPKGFIAIRREDPRRRPVGERVRDSLELYEPTHPEVVRSQAARCMDCGLPFCHTRYGCPVENLIPDWNDLVHRGRWRDALKSLHATNNFPDFTGRLCPAPCESACVLGIIDKPVSIKAIEQNIIDLGWEKGWVRPVPPVEETGFRVAVVGSGPAGLAAAQQLRRAGHTVTVYEKADRIGGLLRYGIPDFKMQKSVLDRRLAQLRAEGVVLRPGVAVGRDLPVADLLGHDAVLLAIGAEQARDLAAPGRDLAGIHPAMDFLVQQNRRLAGETVAAEAAISAQGRRVLVLGGGDTGSDCIGTCHRQGAASVTQIEILPQPPPTRSPETPWPLWPQQLRTSHAHEEGGHRDWSLRTTDFFGQDGRVAAVRLVRLAWGKGPTGQPAPEDVPGTAQEVPADLVLLALGFTGPVRAGLVSDLGVALDPRGAIRADAQHRTSVPKVFAAGDARRGASLVVWAIREGRDAARAMDGWLRGDRGWGG
ncbi:MAG TPA: glutamate synthase subunit beta [Polyangia bacterium]|jgi:glutamate synthase (NADPH/NADH) small chain